MNMSTKLNKVSKMWEKLKLLWSKTNRWHRVILIFLLVELRYIPGGQVGFQCNDPALSHSYTGDTINWKWLISSTAFLPLVAMLLVERKYHRDEKTPDKPRRRALYWYKEYLFGFLLNITFVQTLKLLVGSPRPHFFDTCQPREALSCQGSEYVPEYTCRQDVWQHQSNSSFPSGHTSLAVHAGVFIAYYLRQRADSSRASLGVQSALLAAAALCAASRITDHRHHWWDVLAGAAVAAAILIYSIFYQCKNFKCRDEGTDHSDQSPLQTETSKVID